METDVLKLLGDIKGVWQALKVASDPVNEWRYISVKSPLNQDLLAGIRFPFQREVVFVGFEDIQSPGSLGLPRGKGFEVSNVELNGHEDKFWVALSCEDTDKLDLFVHMLSDVLDTLFNLKIRKDRNVFSAFIERVKSWQIFMSAGSPNGLSKEDEIGLFGELVVFHELLKTGMKPGAVLNSWLGPVRGLQDFKLGNGVLEVKSTLSETGLPIKVSSKEQLDNELIFPMVLSVVRLNTNSKGKSLPQLVKLIESHFLSFQEDIDLFYFKLFRYGFVYTQSDLYVNEFEIVDIFNFKVDEDFPSLKRSMLPNEVFELKYSLDLRGYSEKGLPLASCLNDLGVVYGIS